MSASWRSSISQSVGVEKISDISSFLVLEDLTAKAPIDLFYEEIKEVLSRATPEALSADYWSGPTFVLRVVSITENYLRDILVRSIQLCPISKQVSSSHNISLGSAIWHHKTNFERGAFEHSSFADAKKIINVFKNYVEIDLNKSNKAIIEEFDKICEIRHAIVHSNRILAGKNAISLQIEPCEKIVKVKIGYGELQNIMSICMNLVVSINQAVFEEMVQRWAVSWRKSSSWSKKLEKNQFDKIWKIFFSETDSGNGTIPSALSKASCKKLVKKEYNLT